MTPQKHTLSPTVELWLGDCREVLPGLAGYDAIVTDPPYGMGFEVGYKLTRATVLSGPPAMDVQAGHSGILGDFEPFNPAPLLETGCKNVLLWGYDNFAPRVPKGRVLVWDKIHGHGHADSFSDVELAWHSNTRGGNRIVYYFWKGLTRMHAPIDGETRQHPNQKPVAVLSWCLDQANVQPGQTVLDPYMGSGSIGLACLLRGCKYIGIELDPRHFATAKRRLEAELAQGVLPLEETRKPRQGTLEEQPWQQNT